MFRLILIPLDGTPFAERGVPTAIMLARAGRGRLLLARVHVPPPPLVAVDPVVHSVVHGAVAPDPTPLGEMARMEAAARDYLDEVTRRVAAHAGVPVDSALVSDTEPHDALHAL